ncbi:MAG: bifunctional phosphoserine phosphatase/homoserine phosphotransferase ThrH [Spirochaetaceae bacterium]|nr:MAG: bifunctional phosphoserine phosphatase/homoserine phosphotransferase ThrH [Spirochaetaceae bacterium]
MRVMCLDLEGVLYPEVWIAVAKHFDNADLKVTTREIPDYDELMKHRLSVLRTAGIGMREITTVLNGLSPLDGAVSFLQTLRASLPVIILSDTFEQFSVSIARQLNYPVILCNRLEVQDNVVTGYSLRQTDGKRRAVEGFKTMNLEVFAAGDSYNDLSMILAADRGALFRAPDRIIADHPDIPSYIDYSELLDWAGLHSS